jgi:hypothetical protein
MLKLWWGLRWKWGIMLWKLEEGVLDLKEERFVWLVVSEVSTHGQLAPLFLSLRWGRGHVEEQSCLPHGGHESKRKRKGQGTRSVFPGHTPSDLLPPVSLHLLLFNHIPIMSSYHKSIEGLIHWCGQNPQDPVTSQSSSLSNQASSMWTCGGTLLVTKWQRMWSYEK